MAERVNYKIKLNDKGIFEFEDQKIESKRAKLTCKKANHDYAMQLFKEAITSDPDYANQVSELNDDGWIKFINNLKNKIIEDPKNITLKENVQYKKINCFDLILMEIPKDKFDEEKTFKEFPPNFPNDISDKEIVACNYMNEKLFTAIKEELTRQEKNPQKKILLKKTLDKYGKNPYRNGQIAAQSINIVSSSTDKTLFWTTCGMGTFGRDNDAVYADFIASACEAETMAQIREGLKVKNVDASSTPDEFRAVSAFSALNSKGTVFIASRENLPKGQYLSDTELPILLQNPNVDKIEWINTTKEFLNSMENISDRAKNYEEFSNLSTELINKYKIVVFDRNEYSNVDLTDETNIEFIKEKIIEHIEMSFDNKKKIGPYIPPNELSERFVETIITNSIRELNDIKQNSKGVDEIKKLGQAKNSLESRKNKFKGSENFLISKTLRNKCGEIDKVLKSEKLSPFSILHAQQAKEAENAKKNLNTKLRPLENKLKRLKEGYEEI